MSWIKVSERPPASYGVNVLCYIPSYPDTTIETQRVYNDGRGGVCFSKGWNEGEIFEVTHWQPLPDPPK